MELYNCTSSVSYLTRFDGDAGQCITHSFLGKLKFGKLVDSVFHRSDFLLNITIVLISADTISSGGKMSDRKAVIKNADMSEEMQQVQQTFTFKD